MDLEIVTVGTELLLGFTIDSNAADIARSLGPAGGRVVRKSAVADDGDAIRNAVAEGLSRTGFVIVTGGLGPTRDDITKRSVAAIFGAPLELDSGYLHTLRKRFEKLGRGPMPEANRTQAEVPRGATILRNRRGTAPGLWMEGQPGTVVLLPGVPREMRELLRDEVIPRLRKHIGAEQGMVPVTRSCELRTTGVSESRLADEIGDLDDQLDPVSLAYLPGLDGVDLRLTIAQVSHEEAARALERAAALLRPVLGRDFYGEGDVDLAAVLLERLRQEGLRLAVAESCTGGMVGARITAIPGSSDVFAGGVISYADSSKIRDLGVSEDLLHQHGAVSEPVAQAMVEGACQRFGTQAGVAVTGVAGPGGGSPGKPVGTVWIAGSVGDSRRSLKRWFPGDRSEVRHRGSQAALDLLRRMLDRDR